ncbi:hypothetical protein N7499_011348 [Penicillium canescens]|nr:hypothetical protein N7499_011348 [Penicillium canescens]KAJ6182486.1 hypothetical protein N7485_001128 [Penicillium canescens]
MPRSIDRQLEFRDGSKDGTRYPREVMQGKIFDAMGDDHDTPCLFMGTDLTIRRLIDCTGYMVYCSDRPSSRVTDDFAKVIKSSSGLDYNKLEKANYTDKDHVSHIRSLFYLHGLLVLL